MRGPAAILLFLILLAACGDDNPVDSGPVAPDPTLVGSWAFDSTDMVAVMAAGIADLMRDLGADQDDIDAGIAEFRAAAGAGDLSGIRSTIRFNADGSWEDDSGDSGTWRVEGNTLITVDEDDTEERVKYFVDGDDLTLIFSSELLLDAFRADEDFTDLDVAMFEMIFAEDTNIRFFLKRK